MRRRAEQVDRTRERITEATVRLHTTIGPAAATMSAIADEAGVTRLTLYRHFADRDALFEACMSHWAARNPGPNASRWRAIPWGTRRLRRAVRDVYEFYGRTGRELAPLYRELDAWPPSARERAAAQLEGMIDALLAERRPGTASDRRLRAAAGHVLSFETWRSLVVEQGLPLDAAIDLGVRFLAAADR